MQCPVVAQGLAPPPLTPAQAAQPRGPHLGSLPPGSLLCPSQGLSVPAAVVARDTTEDLPLLLLRIQGGLRALCPTDSQRTAVTVVTAQFLSTSCVPDTVLSTVNARTRLSSTAL